MNVGVGSLLGETSPVSVFPLAFRQARTRSFFEPVVICWMVIAAIHRI